MTTPPIQMQPTSTPSENHEWERKRVDRLFLRLAAIYGRLWKSLHKSAFIEICKEEWLYALKNYDNQTVKEALENCRNKNAYPPTIHEFIGYCKTIKKRRDLMENPVPETVCITPEIAKAHLSQLRKTLHMSERQ